jgi:acetylornithine/succinyldiaminopimelate/putrescine aminotransferase
VLNIIERDELLENARKSGTWLFEKIKGLQSPLVSEVRGLGLMIGIQLSTERFDPKSGLPARLISEQLIRAGLLVIPAGENVIRLLPPLNVSETDLEEAISKLDRVLGSKRHGI